MSMKKQAVLVCGGAGYIGSHMVRMLRDEGYTPLVLDNFSTGHAEAVEGVEVLRVCLRDTPAVKSVFASRDIGAVMHFCAKSLVGESVVDPLPYYENNVGGTLNLLSAMHGAGVRRLIFSSTAAVYGQPEDDAPLAENSRLKPINPYGISKKQVEDILQSCFAAYGLSSASLRYFNAAGAQQDGSIGESHSPESHLIPNMLRAIRKLGPALQIFGDDYPTPDGTCIRDYVHVEDLCRAHLLALAYLEKNEGAHAFNLGNGTGFSVKEVLAAAEEVTGQKVPHSIGPRRAGDPARLVASSQKAISTLGWKPQYTSIHNIIETAWKWHCNQRY